MPKTLIAAFALLLATGCRNALLDTPQPLVRSTLALQARPLTSDTVQVTLVLSTGPVRALGSITAELSNTTDWTFTGCTTAQGEALLACKAHPGAVRVAAAWVAGTHAGDLITLTFVRAVPTARGAWQLSLQEAHSVGGVSLLSDLDIDSALAAGPGGTP
jgi:hypothetical protein